MQIIQSKNFIADEAWDALTITCMRGTSIRLHWTDKPYHWHINNGEEVFVVLDGKVTMHYEIEGQKRSALLEVGDIFYASIGTKHYAEPTGEARILVIEQQGSI